MPWADANPTPARTTAVLSSSLFFILSFPLFLDWMRVRSCSPTDHRHHQEQDASESVPNICVRWQNLAEPVPRPDPGRQHRADESGRQVRIPPRLPSRRRTGSRRAACRFDFFFDQRTSCRQARPSQSPAGGAERDGRRALPEPTMRNPVRPGDVQVFIGPGCPDHLGVASRAFKNTNTGHLIPFGNAHLSHHPLAYSAGRQVNNRHGSGSPGFTRSDAAALARMFANHAPSAKYVPPQRIRCTQGSTVPVLFRPAAGGARQCRCAACPGPGSAGRGVSSDLIADRSLLRCVACCRCRRSATRRRARPARCHKSFHAEWLDASPA
jgi:hypothetical protein